MICIVGFIWVDRKELEYRREGASVREGRNKEAGTWRLVEA